MRHQHFDLWPAETLEHAEYMRRVRNECRQFMTRDTREISREDQIAWFQALDRDTTRPFFGLAIDIKNGVASGDVLAYGLVRLIDNRWWISGGVLPEWRGHGYGRKLFEALTSIVNDGMHRTCWLEVRASNTRAYNLYRALGYIPLRDDWGDDDIWIMSKGAS